MQYFTEFRFLYEFLKSIALREVTRHLVLGLKNMSQSIIWIPCQSQLLSEEVPSGNSKKKPKRDLDLKRLQDSYAFHILIFPDTTEPHSLPSRFITEFL